MLAIIGGSGLSRPGFIEVSQRREMPTPYGAPSSELAFGRMAGAEVLFLARHGEAHSIAPHQINYRANLWALKDAGADAIVSIATVGGIRADLGPGALLVPDQIIDYTWGRASTFSEGAGVPVRHIDFTEPYSASLRARLIQAAARCAEGIAEGGVYAATQGPRLETAAEITRLERDGADVVGMTGMPEAALAREIGLDYAALAVVANFAAGRGDSRHGISLEQIEEVLAQAMGRVRSILEALARA